MPGQRPPPRGKGCPEPGSGRRWGQPGENAVEAAAGAGGPGSWSTHALGPGLAFLGSAPDVRASCARAPPRAALSVP